MPAGIEDSFYYNSMLANGLAQLLPHEEKNIVRSWLQKLHSMPQDKLREEYLWFFLRVLHCKKSVFPFNTYPPFEELPPLKQIIPQTIFDDTLLNFEQEDYDWLNESKLTESDTEKEKVVEPSLFFEKQPKPKNGIFCYMAAFSDQIPPPITKK